MKSKKVSKRQEKEFVDNLTYKDKQYTVFDLKSPEELWNNGNWEGIVYTKNKNILQKIIRKIGWYLLNKCS